MNRRLLLAGGLSALALLALGAAGCGSDDSASGANVVDVKITDAGCEPAELTIPAGATTFDVTNEGADDVTEFEVMDGDEVLGEAENIAPGLSGKFSLTLDAGEYTTYCPGGDTSEHGVLIVEG